MKNPAEPAVPVSTLLYPVLAESDSGAQQFRLQKVSELESYLHAEVDSRKRLHKKYRRAVNALDGTCAVLGTMCVATGAVGAGLLASGIGVVPGLCLEAVTGMAGLLDIAGVAVSRRCTGKAAKHEAVRVLATSKLNTVHSHISKALEDCSISEDEYKLVLDEVKKYRAMKEEIHHKHAPAAGSVIDEATKNELIKRGRDQAHASIIKKLTASESP